MNKKLRTEAVSHLFQAILTLKSPEECYIFFEDVCTINELLSLSQRYEVAKMLREGRTYLEIAEKARLSGLSSWKCWQCPALAALPLSLSSIFPCSCSGTLLAGGFSRFV